MNNWKRTRLFIRYHDSVSSRLACIYKKRCECFSSVRCFGNSNLFLKLSLVHLNMSLSVERYLLGLGGQKRLTRKRTNKKLK